MRQLRDVPADVVEERCRQAIADVDGELIALLACGQFVAFLDTVYGFERLPNTQHWATVRSRKPYRGKRRLGGTAHERLVNHQQRGLPENTLRDALVGDEW